MLATNIDLEEDIKRILNYNEEELNKISNEEVERFKEKKGRTKTLINDIIFKAVFINEPDILLKMIRDIFGINEEINNPITICGYESVPMVYNGKTFKNDLLVRLSDNSCVVIEMNNNSNKGVLERNLIQLFRIHGQILKKGETYNNLDKYQVKGLNFNYQVGKSDNEVDNFAFCNIETRKVATNIVTICNIDIEKCHKLVYTNIKEKEIKNPRSVIWGAIMNEEDISKILDVLGGTLTMEQSERLAKRIEDINDDNKIIKQWMIEDNSRWYIEEMLDNGYNKGREEGIEEEKIKMIKNMLMENSNYKYISKISGKTIEEIKEIEENMKEE